LIGGAGYIGQVAADLLLTDGYDVTVADSLIHGHLDLTRLLERKGFMFLEADINDRMIMNGLAKRYENVVLLAGLVGEAACDRVPDATVHSNFHSPLSFLDSCLYHGTTRRLVFVSTDSCYGERPGETLDEGSPLKPLTLYARLKASLESLILERTEKTPIEAVVIRFATVYGLAPRTRFDLAVNVLTREAVLRKRCQIFSGEQWRPLIHVKDAAKALLFALKLPREKAKGQIYNAGSNSQNIQFSELGRIIHECVPDAVVETVPGAPDLRDYHVSFDKIAKEGFIADRGIRDGVLELKDALLSGLIPDPYSPSLRND
jgi:nucleoside-diphosphate-sugar epimerase